MSDHDDNLMEDHNYDGIYELDNDLPFWWIALFITTVIIGIVYCSYYFLGLGPGQEKEYELAVAEAKRLEKEKEIIAMANSNGKPVEEVVVELPEPTAENIANGKPVFTKFCVACHGPDGAGLVGPNLTDNFFINGPTLADAVKIITKGKSNTAMISWSSQLTKEQIFDVAAFVHSLKGKNLPSIKPPEGQEYK